MRAYKKIYKHKFKCYDIFYNVEIDNINLLDKITSIYKNNSIETAIKESYKYLKKHEEEFINKCNNK